MKYFACAMLLLTIWGCAPKAYFKTPNDVYKEKVILYLYQKPGVSGILTVPFENYYDVDIAPVKTLQFIPEGKTVAENIPIGAIDGYSIGNDYYAMKKLDVLLNKSSHLLFAKRLSSENSRIQLYELYESGKGNNTGEIKYSYFISLPSFDRYETINALSNRLTPDFDLKMSELVEDCPALAKKIRNRQNGYFVPLVSFGTYKRREVFLKIIDEYNTCK